MRIGIGLGAFADGFLRGVGTGRQLKGIRDERELETIRKEGLGEARAQRDAAIDQNIMTLPGAEGAPEQYQVGDQTFTDRGQAREAAGQSVGSVMDFWMEGPVNKYFEALVERGDTQRLEAATKFFEAQRGRSALRSWSGSMAAAQMGDFETAADRLGEYITQHVEPDFEYVGKETLKDGDSVTGFVIKARNKRTGKDMQFPVTPDTMVQFGMMHNPQTVFENYYNQQLAADQARMKDAADERSFQRQQAGRVDLEVIKGQIRNANEQAKFDRNIQVLRRAGYDEAFINSVIPSLIGADTSGPYRKGRSPEETAAMLHEKRLENDFEYRRMSPEERREAIQSDMQMIRDIAEPYMRSRPQSSQQVGQPSGRGAPILDPRTGQMIYR